MACFVGLAFGGGVGFALGLLNGLSGLGEKLTDSTLQMVRNIPHLALIPLVILWFAIGEEAKLFLVALGVFFPLYVNTFHGVRSMDRQLLEMGRAYGTHLPRPESCLCGSSGHERRRPGHRVRHRPAIQFDRVGRQAAWRDESLRFADRAARDGPRHPSRPVRCHRRPQRLRQKHVPAAAGRPRPTERRENRDRRPVRRWAGERPVDVPGVPVAPLAAHQGERRSRTVAHPTGDDRRRMAIEAIGQVGLSGREKIGPRSCPAARSSVSPLRAPWSAIPASWPSTNRWGRWTP